MLIPRPRAMSCGVARRAAEMETRSTGPEQYVKLYDGKRARVRARWPVRSTEDQIATPSVELALLGSADR